MRPQKYFTESERLEAQAAHKRNYRRRRQLLGESTSRRAPAPADPPRKPVAPLPHVVNTHCPGSIAFRLLYGCLAFLLVIGTASAQQFPTKTERTVADATSWGTVLTGAALDTRASWICADRLRCFERQGIRVGVVYGAVFAAKLLVHRPRPCAPDCGLDNPNFSFFSGHTALAFSTLGGPRLTIALPLALSTGSLRVAAGKHWISDVLTGAGVGSLASKIR